MLVMVMYVSTLPEFHTVYGKVLTIWVIYDFCMKPIWNLCCCVQSSFMSDLELPSMSVSSNIPSTTALLQYSLKSFTSSPNQQGSQTALLIKHGSRLNVASVWILAYFIILTPRPHYWCSCAENAITFFLKNLPVNLTMHAKVYLTLCRH